MTFDYNAILADIQKRINQIAYQRAIPSVQFYIDMNFQEKGRWSGNGTGIYSGGFMKWTPLAESTKKAYSRGVKMGGGKSKVKYNDLDPTLKRTGQLLHSISYKSYDRGIIVSTNLTYAARHQFGYRNTPKRPFITLRPEEIQSIANDVVAYAGKN